MKVVAFNGSPRREGNTAYLLKVLSKRLNEQGIETEIVQVGGQIIRGCQACGSCRRNQDRRCVLKDDILNDCLAKMFEADGIVVASPTYFANLTSETKALIDRAGYVARGNGNPLRRKVGAAVVAVRRAGAIHVFNGINHFFLINEMIVPGSSYWNIGLGREPGEVENDREGIGTMETLGDNMAWLLNAIKE